MKTSSLTLALLLAVPLCVPAAEVYRCAAGASVTYQEFPCSAGSGEVKVSLPQSFPEVNAASRDSLLAREAALDRRLEAERERLSREEIARIHARAQVAAAEAIAAVPKQPVYLAAWPMGRPWAPVRRPASPWNLR